MFIKLIKDQDIEQQKSAPEQQQPQQEIDPQLPRNFHSCPDLASPQHQQELDKNHSFKLDHLTDIDPKRLYPNTKFRAKIHDIIDQSGRFSLEVIYPRDDERKFAQIFKLFRLACKISPTPNSIYQGMRIGAMYKGEWYRAIVVDAEASRVKFVDLGIQRQVDRQNEMRLVDEKFFNCPLKSLKCSLYVDEDVKEVLINNNGNGVVKNEKLCLSKEARKFFVRAIYKKG